MALTNMYFKTKLVSCFGERRETVEREEEGEKKRKKMEEPRSSKPRYGTLDFVWKLNLCMDSMRLCMNFHALMIIILPKSRVLLGFHLNPKIMESKVGRTPYGTRSI